MNSTSLIAIVLSLLVSNIAFAERCPLGASPKHTNCIEVKDVNWLKSYEWSDGFRSQSVALPSKQEYNLNIKCQDCKSNSDGDSLCRQKKNGVRLDFKVKKMPSIYSLRYIERYQFDASFNNLNIERYFSMSDIPSQIRIHLRDLPLNNQGCYDTDNGEIIYPNISGNDIILPYGTPRFEGYSYASSWDKFSLANKDLRRDEWNNKNFTYNKKKYYWSEKVELPLVDPARISNSRVIANLPKWEQLSFEGKTPGLYDADETVYFRAKNAARDLVLDINLTDLSKDENNRDVVKYFDKTSKRFLNPRLQQSEIRFYLAIELSDFGNKASKSGEPDIYLYMSTGENEPAIRFKKLNAKGDISNASKRSLLMDILTAGSVAKQFMGVDYELILEPIVNGAYEALTSVKDHQIEKPFMYMFSHFENIAAEEIDHLINGVKNPMYTTALKKIRDSIDQINGKWYAMSSMEGGYLTIRQQARLMVHPLQKARMAHRQKLNADPFISKWIDIMINNAVMLSATASTGDVAVENLEQAATLIQLVEFTHPDLQRLEFKNDQDPVTYLRSIMTNSDKANLDSNLETMKRIITGNSSFKSQQDLESVINSLN